MGVLQPVCAEMCGEQLMCRLKYVAGLAVFLENEAKVSVGFHRRFCGSVGLEASLGCLVFWRF